MTPDPPSGMTTRLVQNLQRAQRRRLVLVTVVRTVAVTVFGIGAYYLVPFTGADVVSIVVRSVLAGACVIVIVLVQVRAVARAEYPQLRAIESLVFASLVVVVAFAAAYLGMSTQDAGAFNEELEHTSSLYFTITTLATVGYGDITAQSDAARVIVMIQMIADVAVLGAAIRMILGRARSRIGSSATGPRSAAAPSGTTEM
jgi:hypothetical protein